MRHPQRCLYSSNCKKTSWSSMSLIYRQEKRNGVGLELIQLFISTAALENAQGWVLFTREAQWGCGAWFWLRFASVQLWSGTASFIVILAFSCWKSWEEDWYLACDSGCFVEDFGCSMERILSGQTSRGGTWCTMRGIKCCMNANIYRTQADLLRCIRPSGLLPRFDTKLRADSIYPSDCWGEVVAPRFALWCHCLSCSDCAGSPSSQEHGENREDPVPSHVLGQHVAGEWHVLSISHSTLGVAAAGCTLLWRGEGSFRLVPLQPPWLLKLFPVTSNRKAGEH